MHNFPSLSFYIDPLQTIRFTFSSSSFWGIVYWSRDPILYNPFIGLNHLFLRVDYNFGFEKEKKNDNRKIWRIGWRWDENCLVLYKNNCSSASRVYIHFPSSSQYIISFPFKIMCLKYLHILVCLETSWRVRQLFPQIKASTM